jgi:hypothetical protein
MVQASLLQMPPSSHPLTLSLITQDARQAGDSNVLARKIQEYDQELEAYIPILMAQAHIHWQLGHYSDVLRIFNQSKEFASEHEVWKLNVAHTHFMMVSVAHILIHFYVPVTVCHWLARKTRKFIGQVAKSFSFGHNSQCLGNSNRASIS